MSTSPEPQFLDGFLAPTRLEVFVGLVDVLFLFGRRDKRIGNRDLAVDRNQIHLVARRLVISLLFMIRGFVVCGKGLGILGRRVQILLSLVEHLLGGFCIAVEDRNSCRMDGSNRAVAIVRNLHQVLIQAILGWPLFDRRFFDRSLLSRLDGRRVSDRQNLLTQVPPLLKNTSSSECLLWLGCHHPFGLSLKTNSGSKRSMSRKPCTESTMNWGGMHSTDCFLRECKETLMCCKQEMLAMPVVLVRRELMWSL